MHGSVVVTDWHATKVATHARIKAHECSCTPRHPLAASVHHSAQKSSVKSGLRLPVGTLTTQLRIGASHVPQLQ